MTDVIDSSVDREDHSKSAGAPAAVKEALESAYYDWWAENDSVLSSGLPGDVFDLRLRLNAAFANSLTSKTERVE